MTSTFFKLIFVRLKSHQPAVYRIKFQHLRGVTAIGWKKTKHIRKIHVSILLIVDMHLIFI